jgi:hypothetical protein
VRKPKNIPFTIKHCKHHRRIKGECCPGCEEYLVDPLRLLSPPIEIGV